MIFAVADGYVIGTITILIATYIVYEGYQPEKPVPLEHPDAAARRLQARRLSRIIGPILVLYGMWRILSEVIKGQ